QVAPQPAGRSLVEGDQSLLAALAEAAHQPRVEIHRLSRQPHDLRNSHTRSVRQLEEGAVTQALRRCQVRLLQQAGDLSAVEGPGKTMRFLRRVELRGIDVQKPLATCESE